MSDRFEAWLEIVHLLHRYCELVDAADWVRVGELFADATVVFEGPGGQALGELRGADEVRASFEAMVLVHEDGTPRTRHLVSNPTIDIDVEAGTATARCCVTVLQSPADGELRLVWSIRYEDRLRRADGAWRFEHRRGSSSLIGDTSAHLRS